MMKSEIRDTWWPSFSTRMFGTSGIEEYISGGAFPSCLAIRHTFHLLLERVISLKPITDADPVDGLYK